MSALDDEKRRRDGMWTELLKNGGPRGVAPQLVRELGFYGGAAGIWVNKAVTGVADPSGNGIAVGLLHTGSAYPDDIDETGVLYHYPTTNRPVGHDRGEIEATKAAAKHRIPVFVITPSDKSGMRDIHLGRVVDFDDEARVFLVSFSDAAISESMPTALEEDQSPFLLIGAQNNKKRPTNVRDGQPGFKFRVFRRYGSGCAVCPITVSELLDAAHIREKHDQGSDDARNGIVLCATHHRAFDRGFFGFDPDSLRVVLKASISHRATVGITKDSILHLRCKPHRIAMALG